jgi:RNA polymerase sigma-70 factor
LTERLDHQRDWDASLLLESCEELVTSLHTQSCSGGWGLTRAGFLAGLARSAEKRFATGPPSSEKLQEYLQTLYLEDLALACACLEGSESAWEHFFREFRGYLRAAAGAITKGSHAACDPQELADSLYAELFGLVDGKRGDRSLFRYFHGRSSLKTWLRTILAQRHIDRIRESRRWETLEGVNGEENKHVALKNVTHPRLDPHRERYLSCFVAALKVSLAALEHSDRQRLELYYDREMTLAEIGRKLGEHESSVSRNLDRVRRELREGVEEQLRQVSSLSVAEILQCIQYAAEEAPIDFRQLFPKKDSGKPSADRKESS